MRGSRSRGPRLNGPRLVLRLFSWETKTSPLMLKSVWGLQYFLGGRPGRPFGVSQILLSIPVALRQLYLNLVPYRYLHPLGELSLGCLIRNQSHRSICGLGKPKRHGSFLRTSGTPYPSSIWRKFAPPRCSPMSIVKKRCGLLLQKKSRAYHGWCKALFIHRISTSA